jgi:anti-sigma factor RsiW
MSPLEFNDTALSQYLDGELPPDQASRIQQHRRMPRCAAEVSRLVSLKRGLHAAERYFAPSAEFGRKIQQQVSRRPRGKWNTRLVWAFGVLSVALVFPLSGWGCRGVPPLSAKSPTCTSSFHFDPLLYAESPGRSTRRL